MTSEITLGGCVPGSLIMNLKALGTFRILALQGPDKDIKARWRHDRFVLATSLSQDDIVEFFLNEYAPTPLISPWNNGGGFFDAKEAAIDRIERSGLPRMDAYAAAISEARRILEEHVPEYRLAVNSGVPQFSNHDDQGAGYDGSGHQLGKEAKHIYDELAIAEEKKANKGKGKKKGPTEILGAAVKKLKDAQKGRIMGSLRNRLGDDVVPWLDAVYMSTPSDPSYAPLLGTGANDGNFDIADNFAQCVCRLLLDTETKGDGAEVCLRASLLGDGGAPAEADRGCLDDMSNAFYFPGGFISNKLSLTSPWDYVLAIEGTLLFAGSMSRRSNTGKAAFPFTADSTPSGHGTAADEDTRGEVWFPIWETPASYAEVAHMFSEGRSQIGSRRSSTGADFARAAASLGTERGLSAFQRFVIASRKGDRYYMSSDAGRIHTGHRQAAAVNLFADFDAWLEVIRRTRNLPTHISMLLRMIDGAMIRYCAHPTLPRLQDVLVAVGEIEAGASRSLAGEGVRPLEGLSPEWATECYDKTPEYRIAAALASISDPGGRYPIRHNVEPVRWDPKAKRPRWDPSSTRFVWGSGGLIRNMEGILARRGMDEDALKNGAGFTSGWQAPVRDVMLFLEPGPGLDHGRIEALLPALSMIRYKRGEAPYGNDKPLWEIPDYVPEPYVCIKSNFPPLWNKISAGQKTASGQADGPKRPDDSGGGGKGGAAADPIRKKDTMPFEPRMAGILRSGQAQDAWLLGMRRLRVSGRNVGSLDAGIGRSNGRQTIPDALSKRLMAAALIPVEYGHMAEMVERIEVPDDVRDKAGKKPESENAGVTAQ